jgi:GntR family transcriptional regulator
VTITIPRERNLQGGFGARDAFDNPPMPLHFQVREYILGLIWKGQLRPGDKLPTENELLDQLGVSRTTVRRALQDLTNAGIINRHAGLGTFVGEPRIEQELRRLTGFVEDMEALGLRASARVVTTEEIPAPAKVANVLHVLTGTTVMHIQRVRMANNEPISFDDSYVPLEYGVALTKEDLTVRPLYTLFEREMGMPLSGADYVLQATEAAPFVAEQLDYPTGSPVFLIERTTYTAVEPAPRPILFEYLYYRGDRVKYRLTLKRGEVGSSESELETSQALTRSE